MIDREIDELLRRGDRSGLGPAPDPESGYGATILERIHREAGIDADQSAHHNVIGLEAGPTRRRGRRSVLLVAIAAALFATGAGFYFATRAPTATLSVACHSDARLASDIYVVSQPATISPAACGPAWTSGLLVNADTEPGDVPNLVGCTLQSGVLGVFPGDEQTCADLGLPVAKPVAAPIGPSVLDVTDSVLLDRCVSIEQAAPQIRNQLNAAGLDFEVVPPVSRAADQPCASVAIDENTKTILIVPIPDNFDS